MKTLLTLTALCLVTISFGQEREKCCKSKPLTPVVVSDDVTNLPEIENYDGTYQFRVPEGDSFSFTYALLEHIESKRQADRDVILDLGNGRSVFIVAASTIQDDDFVPFESAYKIIQ